MGTLSLDGTTGDKATKRQGTALVIGLIPIVFDTTIMNIALSTLAKEFHASVSSVQWVTTGYLLALALAIPLSGWLVERFGGKRVWLSALGIYLLGSLACSVSWSMESLITFRAIQGFGGGILLPALMTIMMKSVDKSKIGAFSAMMALPAVIGPMLGPVICGAVLSLLNWHWIFLVNAVPGVVGFVLVGRVLPKDDAGTTRVPFDFVGLVLLSLGTAALLYGLSNIARISSFDMLSTLVPCSAGLVLLALFVVWSIRHPGKSIVELRLFRKRTFSISSVLLFLTGIANYGPMLLLPLYYQQVKGMDVLQAALFLVPQGFGTFLSRGIAGKWTDKYGPRWVTIAGLTVVLIGTIPFVAIGADTSVWLLGIVLVVRGVGLGAVSIPINAGAYQELAKTEISHGSVITRIAMQLGGSFGTAIIATVLHVSLTANAASGVPGTMAAYQSAFGLTLCFTILAIAFAMFQPVRPRNLGMPRLGT